MEVSAKITIRKIDIDLTGKGTVNAEIAFKIGNMPMPYMGHGRVTVPLTDGLRKCIEDNVSEQIGEIITKDEGVGE